MKNFYLKILKNQTGAMDKILVTLLLVIVGVAGVVAIESWFGGKKNDLVNSSNNSITNVMNNS